jgi:hypothetical protein
MKDIAIRNLIYLGIGSAQGRADSPSTLTPGRPRRFTVRFATVFFALAGSLAAQTSAPWKAVQDAKGACRISVPPEWTPYSDASGAAVFRDATTAIAVVTSQPGQKYKPLTERQLEMLGVARDKIFENSAKRLFYQDKTARDSDDSNAYSVMVPGNGGTCSCHVVFTHDIPQETARKIALSVAAVEEKQQ